MKQDHGWCPGLLGIQPVNVQEIAIGQFQSLTTKDNGPIETALGKENWIDGLGMATWEPVRQAR
jgi:hypothetical protein